MNQEIRQNDDCSSNNSPFCCDNAQSQKPAFVIFTIVQAKITPFVVILHKMYRTRRRALSFRTANRLFSPTHLQPISPRFVKMTIVQAKKSNSVVKMHKSKIMYSSYSRLFMQKPLVLL
ncbi:MAG: hypothetical protein LBR73_01620 [Oscillospiraceae bacterium]|jgi:hypothetical protein|nr:hypothetical protein [Oscillospiraceae bacterium]